MEAFKIFVIEDDNWYGEIIKYHLTLNPDWEVSLFTTGKEALEQLHLNPSFITLDYTLPDMNGLEILQRIREHNDTIPVVIISGQDEISTAVDLLKKGAYDYIEKNDKTKDRIWNSIKHIRENLEVCKELNELKEEVAQKYNFSKSIIGKSTAITQTFSLIEKATKTNINVSISGETGTGKELVAKAIHYNSDRSKKPFITINMSAIPNELIESELFGHEKGAYTGANSRRIGKFEEAQDGTLFLDEIGDLDLKVQAKLLRALQEREVVRIGGNTVIKIKARVIVATHRILAKEVEYGNFREDLYFRLLGLPIKLAPLHERSEDIIMLSKHFIKTFCEENRMNVYSLNNEAVKKLMQYHFPGNIRELKAIIEVACVMATSPEIESKDIIFNTIYPQTNLFQEEKTLKEYNNQIISTYLQKYNNDISFVAQKLKIGKSSIYRMIKENEINAKN